MLLQNQRSIYKIFQCIDNVIYDDIVSSTLGIHRFAILFSHENRQTQTIEQKRMKINKNGNTRSHWIYKIYFHLCEKFPEREQKRMSENNNNEKKKTKESNNVNVKT